MARHRDAGRRGGTRHVFQASKWRVLDIAEYGEADDEVFGDTGVEVSQPAATIFDKDGDLQAGRASARDDDEEDRDFCGADPEMLKAKLESLKSSLGGRLPEVSVQPTLPLAPPPKFPPDPPPRPAPPAAKSSARSPGGIGELFFTRAAERVQRAASSSSASRPLSGGPPGLQGPASGNSSTVTAALNSLVSALQSADTGFAEPEAGGSVFREAPSRAFRTWMFTPGRILAAFWYHPCRRCGSIRVPGNGRPTTTAPSRFSITCRQCFVSAFRAISSAFGRLGK